MSEADPRWTHFLAGAEPRDRVRDGNRLTHLRDDDRAVRAIWKRIEEAEERVWMSMYILAPDRVGLGTVERLAEAARRGCDVRLLYDYVGSIRLRERHLAPLGEAGGRYAPFNRVWPPWKRSGSLRVRNHRKLILVDVTAALCGGLNLCDDYTGEFGDEWIFDDTVVMIEGPSVYDMLEIFRRTWHEVTGEVLEAPPLPDPLEDGIPLQVLESDPRRPDTRLREALRAAVSRTRERCFVATPYFIPADWLTAALADVAAGGADVRIMTAGRTDLLPARGAARHAYGPLLEAGVRILEMYGRILHSKFVTIDGCFGLIGSYNLDRWTARHTLDLSVAVVSRSMARSLEEEFHAFAQDASEFTLAQYHKRGLPTRALHWMADKIVERV